jgi:hypothetical protein
MKNTILILSFLLVSLTGFSQSIFDKYQDMEHVNTVNVTQKMFKMLADIETKDPDSDAFINQAKSLKNLRVYTTSNVDVSKAMEKDIARYIISDKLEELMRIKDEASSVKFYVIEGKDDNHVKELLMFAKGLSDKTKNSNISVNGIPLGVETVFLSLKGEIDLREVSKLTTRLNVPGGELLNKSTKE